MQSFLNQIILTIGDWSLTVSQLASSLSVIIVCILFYRITTKARWLTSYYENSKVDKVQIKKLNRQIIYFVIFLVAFVLMKILHLDFSFFESNDFFMLSLLLEGLLILQGARILDWLITNTFIHRYYVQRDAERKKLRSEIPDAEQAGSKVVQYIVYAAAIIVLINNLNLDYTIFSTNVGKGDGSNQIRITLSNVIIAALILLVSRLVVWLLTQLFLYGIYKKRGVDKGSQFAVNQLLKYFVYFIAVFLALDHLGINMTLIWTGAAALLVGIGLGLQQTFNDFISGLVLLFERSTSVGDILEFGGNVGIVREIGLRASVLETRDNVSMVVPNSKLVNDNVINWSHFSNKVRFKIRVGVAYGSDTALVKKILLDSVGEHKDVLPYPNPVVQFKDFGDSALIFDVFFYSRNFMYVENVLSDIRFEIDRKFREQGVTIPFPQRDVWFKSIPEDLGA